jgi:hypothetical protein
MNKIANCPVILTVYDYLMKGQTKEKVYVTAFSNGG